MDQTAPRLTPLPSEHTAELKDQVDAARKPMGFVPNSVLIMQRSPKMVRAFAQMGAAIWSPPASICGDVPTDMDLAI